MDEKQKMDSVQLIDMWNKKFQADIDATQGQRWEWFKNMSYVQGDQWTYFNKATKKLVELPRRDSREIRVTINIIWYMLRAIRGFVLRFQPRHEVTPVGTNEENYENARRTNALMDWNWTASGLDAIVGDAVYNACSTSIGPVLLSWDSKNNMVKYTALNPLNFFWDAFGGDDDSNIRHFGFRFEATEDEIRSNPEYDMIQDDTKLTPSSSMDNRDDILELFEKRVLKENKEGTSGNTPRLKGVEIYYQKGDDWYVITWIIGMNQPLRHKKYDFDFNPIETLHTDKIPGKVYGTGIVKHALPPQTVINRLESARLSYIAMAGKYRILTPKTSGIKEIHDLGGTRIEYDGTSPFSQPRELSGNGMPNDVDAQLIAM
jgi:hypothetical protein